VCFAVTVYALVFVLVICVYFSYISTYARFFYIFSVVKISKYLNCEESFVKFCAVGFKNPHFCLCDNV